MNDPKVLCYNKRGLEVRVEDVSTESSRLSSKSLRNYACSVCLRKERKKSMGGRGGLFIFEGEGW